MDKQPKYLTSHKSRVERAKEIVKESPEKISIFDREAFVEFFLLEDIERLYLYRYKKVQGRKKETREGVFYQKKQLEKMHYLLYMLKKCIDVMEGKLDDGAYSDVWKAIHEHQLMVAAGNMKYLDNLVALTETMLGDVDKSALELAKKKRKADEFMDDLEEHDANARTVWDLPSESDVEGMLEAVEVEIPDDRKKRKPNLN